MASYFLYSGGCLAAAAQFSTLNGIVHQVHETEKCCYEAKMMWYP